MKLSARNQLKGIVTNIEVGAVNVEVTLNVELTSILTK
ncbi:TOBE domain-containing protein [Photobacterium angustum]|nr:TOBE domain-containing protein [Photobacterium angustum]